MTTLEATTRTADEATLAADSSGSVGVHLFD
jgi:hypothetical protein